MMLLIFHLHLQRKKSKTLHYYGRNNESTSQDNAWGNTLLRIVTNLEDLGWTTQEGGLAGLDNNIMMIGDDESSGEFWHKLQIGPLFGSYHKDKLKFEGRSLVRICPIAGQEIISTAAIKG